MIGSKVYDCNEDQIAIGEFKFTQGGRSKRSAESTGCSRVGIFYFTISRPISELIIN